MLRCWYNSAVWTLLAALFLPAYPVSCTVFNIKWNSTTNVTLNAYLGDKVRVSCPEDRYDNILYLPTEQQLKDCNVSSLSPDYQQMGLPRYIHVGSCAGRAVPFFVIEIRQTSEFLVTSVPFQNGGIYYFTSFTDGSAYSAHLNPTQGGDCADGLSLTLHVIDPNPVTHTESTELTTVETTQSSTITESEVEETVQPPEVLPISSSVLSCTCLSYLLLLTFLVIFL